VIVTPDLKTFIFNPYGTSPTDHLGSAINDVTYIALLTNNIEHLDTQAGVFAKQIEKQYAWDFTTNTTIDITPPFITSVSPVHLDLNGQPIPADSGDPNSWIARNTKIMVNFSEPVIPPLYLNQTEGGDVGLNEITVETGGSAVAGYFVTGINQYRSVVFKPTGQCMEDVDLTNTCGDPIFCLPAEAKIDTLVKSVVASNLLDSKGPTVSIFPAGGIVDAALNALDTNGQLGKSNGLTEGLIDSFSWDFITSKEFDLVPPQINTNEDLLSPVTLHLQTTTEGASPAMTSPGVTPRIGNDKSDGIKPDSIVSAYFNEAIDPSSATNHHLVIVADGWNKWYTGGLFCPPELAADGSVFCQTDEQTVVINHANFPEAQSQDDIPYILPKISSGVEDMFGNCYNPAIGPNCENVAVGQACCAVQDPATGNYDMAPQFDAQGKKIDSCPY
jgi:hypothetical protein